MSDFTTFITVEELKSSLGVTSFEVVRNPKTSKLFISYGSNEVLRVEQAIDFSKPVSFGYTEVVTDGCLINTKQNNVVMTF